jgi:hypothetical protein
MWCKKSEKRNANNGRSKEETMGDKKQAVDVATDQNMAAAGAPCLRMEISLAAPKRSAASKILRTAVGASIRKRTDPYKKEDWIVRGTFWK